MKSKRSDTIISRFRHRLWVCLGAAGLTLVFFLILPLMQTITQPRHNDLELQGIDTAQVPPPPPPPEPEQEEEPEEEPPPPELTEEAPPLDLSQLELALNPGFSEGWMGGDFAVKLNTVASQDDALDAVFSMADLDQKPRVIYQPGPTLDGAARRKAPGTVYILFIVDQRGRVENPVIQKSTDPVFEKPALAAVKQWKFEPGKRNGQAVRFRMRVPVTFPKG
jgi:periplasmic protein TonB